MTLLYSIARILHIISGVLWAGGALVLYFFIVPTIGATGDSGKQFIGHLVTKTRFTAFMMTAATTTALAGGTMYIIDSNWLRSGWVKTGTGIGFTIGAAAGILAYIFGLISGDTNNKLAALGAQIQGKPTPEQMFAMQALLKRQAMAGRWNAVCMIIAVLFMASARVLG